MTPLYPVYIVSKGRWEHRLRLTARALDNMKIPYFIVVEDSQLDQYAAAVGAERCLVLPEKYKAEYDLFGKFDDGKTGPGPARNFAWQHSIDSGHKWHWVMDDNIGSFRRLHNNLQIRVSGGAIFRAMEDWCDRYENVVIGGPQYDFFLPSKYAFPPYVLNTRVYSCLLIRNDLPHRWRGRYNEDTDLCLRALKSGFVTVQFNAFIQEKKETQGMRGGNTDEFYLQEGTKAKSEMLASMHPDCAKVIWKYGRWHHHVNYKVFKQRPTLRSGIVISAGPNNYGMVLSCSNDTARQEVPK